MASSEKKAHNPIIMMRKRSEFLAAQKGVRSTGSCLRIEAKPTGENSRPAHVGITVTKKNGNSVVRSRIKRRIRHALYCHLAGDMRLGHDYVFIAKPNAVSAPFDTLRNDIADLIKKSHKRLDANPAQNSQ